MLFRLYQSILSGLMAFCLLAFSSSGFGKEDGLEINLNLGITQEDNIKRGFYGNDVQSGTTKSLELAAAKEVELTNLSLLFYRLAYLHNTVDEYEKLSSQHLAAQVDYVFQNGLSFSYPLYTLSARLEEADYDSILRDSTIIKLSAKLLKRMTTRIKLSSGLAYWQREADTNVFDIKITSLFALADYKLSQQVSFYLMYQIQKGDSTSTVTTTDPDLLAQQVGYATINEADAAGALLPDDAYGGAAAGQYAYRNAAQHDIIEYGVNYSVNAHHAFDLSIQQVATTLDTGKTYDNYLISLRYLSRF